MLIVRFYQSREITEQDPSPASSPIFLIEENIGREAIDSFKPQ